MLTKQHISVLLLVYINVCVFCEYLSVSEGESCSWKDMTGTCVLIYRCLSAKEFVKQVDRPPVCEYKGKVPVICCTDCELVEDARNIIISPQVSELIYKTGEKAHDKCLDFKFHLGYFVRYYAKVEREWKRNETRSCQELVITNHDLVSPVGGRDVVRGEFPHMALLGYGLEWISAQWLCGGTLISTYFVLTAGHCISAPGVGPLTYVGLGVLKRSDEPGEWYRYKVKRIIPHPDYHPPSKYNDIALLETGAPVLFNGIVKPACLGKSKPAYSGFNEATGWGKLGHRKELADTMQAIELEEFTEEQCMREYPPHRHLLFGYNHTTQMCFGRRDEIVDTCEGDSGGPLHEGKDSDDVIGVTSYGRSCGISTGAGMYTRVSFYLPWIESIVWPDT